MARNDEHSTLWDTIGDAGAGDAACALCDAPDRRSLPPAVAAAVRAAYFADGGELAVRYGVGVGDVIAHLERAGLARMPRPARAAEHIKCAVHATALAAGTAQAWADLLTALGPGFDRACAARLNAKDGIAFARRFWIDLRTSTNGAEANGGRPGRDVPVRRPRGVRAPDLRNFAATRPMRYWLAERLLGSLETELGRAASASERLDTVEEARTLRIPAPMAAGAETRPG